MKKSPRPFRLPWFIGCLLLLIAVSPAAQATEFYWVPSHGDGLYSDPGNWFTDTVDGPDGPPKAGDTANFPMHTVQFKAGDASDAATISGGSTQFDLTSGGYNVSGAITISNNGILTVYGSSDAGNTLAVGSIVSNGGGPIEIDSGVTLSAGSVTANIDLELGTAKVSGQTAGTIEVDGGSFSTGSVNATGIVLNSPDSQPSQFSVAGDLTTTAITVSGHGSVASADTALASGDISVDTGATLQIDGAMEFGLAGNGSTLSTMSVKTGGFVTCGTSEVTGNVGYITVDGIGSDWLVNGLLQADATSVSGESVDVNNGGSLSVGSMDLGVAAGSSGNIMIEDTGLLGSSFSVTQGPLRIGVGGSAYLSVNDAKATISGGAPIQLGVNPGSSGSLYVAGSGGVYSIGAAELNEEDAPIQVGIGGQGQMTVSDGAIITTGPVYVAVQPTSGTSDSPSGLSVDGSATTLTIHGPLVVAKSGGTAAVYTLDGGTLVAQSLQLGVHGSLDVTGGQGLVGSGMVPAAGTLLVAGGGILSGQNRVPGTNVVNPGVTGNVVIGAGGTFVPGGDPNVFSIQGDCDLSGGGVGGGETDIEVADAGTAGTDYDQLVVSGTLTLGGTLKLVLLNGYTPKVGDTLGIISAGTISGSFAQITAPGLTLSPVASAGKLSVTVTGVSAVVAPVVTSATAATGYVGSPFSYQIAATNSPAGYTATGLPDGLTLNAASGLISGTPTVAGTFNVGIAATNVGGTGTATLVLTVVAATPGAPVITSAASATGTLGQAFSYQLTATNAPTGFAAGGVPVGLVFDASTGILSGVPTAAGTFTVSLSAINASGTGTGTLTLTIASVAGTPTVTVKTVGDGMAVEGGEAGKVKVIRTGGDMNTALIVRYKVAGGVVAGKDYKALPGTVTIPAGAAQAKVKIKPIDDSAREGTRTAKVKLKAATNGSYILGSPANAKVRIIDND